VSGDDVLAVLDALDEIGVGWWILGGWGVDALLRKETRAHHDLDLAIQLDDLARVEKSLPDFRRASEDEYPGFVVLVDPAGRRLDLLLLADEGEGGYRQRLAGGGTIDYARDETEATGAIAGRPVRCASLALQLREHERPEADEVDRRDAAALRARFGANS
jgi:lincosamide nucleotidyltransferase A/C/D/E